MARGSPREWISGADRDFRLGEIEALPYADETFDVVTAMNSIQFAAEPAYAVREARRAVRSGGRVTTRIFGKPEEVETTAIFAAVGKLLPAPPPGAAGPFALSADGALEALVTAVGLEPASWGEVECLWQYPDQRTILRGFLFSGLSTRALQLVGEETVRRAILDAAAPFRTGSAGYELKSRARYLTAAR